MSRSKKLTFLEMLDYLMLFFKLRANIKNNNVMIILVCSKDWEYPHTHASPVSETFKGCLSKEKLIYSQPSGVILDCALIILKSWMLDWRNLPPENYFLCRKNLCRFFHSKVNRNTEKFWEVNKVVMVNSFWSERLQSVMPLN